MLFRSAFPGHRQGAGREAGLPGLEPAPIWDPGRARRGLNHLCHCAGPTIPFFFKDLFYYYYYYYYFIGKADIQRGETERKIFRPMIHSPSERNSRYYADPKPGASSGSPTPVQGLKAFGRPRLLSQATGRELEGKRGCWD